jgi:hypothetical protein
MNTILKAVSRLSGGIHGGKAAPCVRLILADFKFRVAV